MVRSLLVLSLTLAVVYAQYGEDKVSRVKRALKETKERHEGYVGKGIHGAVSTKPHKEPWGDSRRKTRRNRSVPAKKHLEVNQAVYDGLGGNYAAEQVDPASPYVALAETHPKKSSAAVSEAVYAPNSEEALEAPAAPAEAVPEAAPAEPAAPEPAPASSYKHIRAARF